MSNMSNMSNTPNTSSTIRQITPDTSKPDISIPYSPISVSVVSKPFIPKTSKTSTSQTDSSRQYTLVTLREKSDEQPLKYHPPGSIEVSAYNVVSDQDHDILNQGSIDHIKRYFDKIESDADMGGTSYIIIRQSTLIPSDYSINSIMFVIKFTIFLIFVWIVWNFINKK
jgi:hypothetical protein